MSRDVGQGRFPYIEPGTVPYIERMVQYRGMVVQYRDRLAFWACELFFPAPTDNIMLTDLTCVAAARRDVSERIVVMVSGLCSPLATAIPAMCQPRKVTYCKVF